METPLHDFLTKDFSVYLAFLCPYLCMLSTQDFGRKATVLRRRYRTVIALSADPYAFAALDEGDMFRIKSVTERLEVDGDHDMHCH